MGKTDAKTNIATWMDKRRPLPAEQASGNCFVPPEPMHELSPRFPITQVQKESSDSGVSSLVDEFKRSLSVRDPATQPYVKSPGSFDFKRMSANGSLRSPGPPGSLSLPYATKNSSTRSGTSQAAPSTKHMHLEPHTSRPIDPLSSGVLHETTATSAQNERPRAPFRTAEGPTPTVETLPRPSQTNQVRSSDPSSDTSPASFPTAETLPRSGQTDQLRSSDRSSDRSPDSSPTAHTSPETHQPRSSNPFDWPEMTLTLAANNILLYFREAREYYAYYKEYKTSDDLFVMSQDGSSYFNRIRTNIFWTEEFLDRGREDLDMTMMPLPYFEEVIGHLDAAVADLGEKLRDSDVARVFVVIAASTSVVRSRLMELKEKRLGLEKKAMKQMAP